MIRTGSLAEEAAEDHALLWRREVPPPVRHKALNLSKEEDLLSKAPQWVSFKEESSIEITSRSIRGYWVEPQNCYPSCQWQNQKGTKTWSIENVSWRLKRQTKKKGETVRKEARKFRERVEMVISNQTSTPFKEKTNSSVTSESWSGALKFHTTA